MSPVEVPLSFHVALAPQPGSVENARQILANGRQLVEQESGTLQWFAYQLDDKEDGSPGGFGAFGTCTDAAAREAHINGPFLRSLTTSTELFAGKPEIRPVETLCFKTTPTEGRSPSLGARVVIKAKPKSVHKIKRTLTGQYFDDVKEETRTAFWYAFQADETTFGLFAAFFSDEDRTTHLNGHGMWHMMDEIALSMEGIKSVKFPIVAFKA